MLLFLNEFRYIFIQTILIFSNNKFLALTFPVQGQDYYELSYLWKSTYIIYLHFWKAATSYKAVGRAGRAKPRKWERLEKQKQQGGVFHANPEKSLLPLKQTPTGSILPLASVSSWPNIFWRILTLCAERMAYKRTRRKLTQSWSSTGGKTFQRAIWQECRKAHELRSRNIFLECKQKKQSCMYSHRCNCSGTMELFQYFIITT